MADVTGPISSLPGSSRKPPDGAHCDDHPARMAVARVQGETDSFGSEMHDLCAECLTVWRNEVNDTSGRCDWCKTEQPVRVPTRDYDEGSCGPVYYVCVGCRRDYFAELYAQSEED